MDLSASPKAQDIQVMSMRNLKAAASLQNYSGTLRSQGINSTGTGNRRAGSTGSSTNDSSSVVSDNSTSGSNKRFFGPLYISSLHLERPQHGLNGDRAGRQQQRSSSSSSSVLHANQGHFWLSGTDSTAKTVGE